jgi:predicted N-formylglutamate amidohydrolase
MLKLVLSCEHATNEVPRAWTHLFRESDAVLQSHRGWDPGALALARQLKNYFGAPLYEGRVSRLLVELNRPMESETLWSEFTASLDAVHKDLILGQYYHPYWASVINATGRLLEKGASVLHLGLHTFTPVWDGLERDVDIGLLYDPASQAETDFCLRWAAALEKKLPGMRIRFNEPYKGTDEGLTTELRRLWAGHPYLGIELELSQRYPLADVGRWVQLRNAVEDTLEHMLSEGATDGQMALFL